MVSKSEARPSGFATIMYMIDVIFIGLTSYIDALMVVWYRTTASEEQNPIGSFLIKTTGQEGFFVAKMIGTMIAIFLVIFLFKIWHQAAYLVMAVITIFQLLLMYYIFS